PPAAAIFSFRMCLKTDAGYLETDDEVASMLADCGCEQVHIERVQGLKSIIRARRGAAARSAARAQPETTGAACRRPWKETEEVTPDPQRSAGQISLWRELVSVASSFRLANVLFAAAELDLFSKIPPEGCGVGEVARGVGLPEVGARTLMNALAAI